MAVSANDEPTILEITEDGGQGIAGADGSDGAGFNQVRYSKINNPLCHLFKTNQLSNVSAPTDTDSDVTTTRATIKKYISRYGRVDTKAINELAEESKGFSIEDTGTNLILQSEDFTTTWNNAGDTSVVANNETAPDGALTADTITTTSSSVNNYMTQGVSITDTGQDIVFSLFCKSGTVDNVIMRTVSTGGTSQDILSVFNASTGVFDSVGSGHTVKSITLTNGYYRIEVMFTLNNTSNTSVIARSGTNLTGSVILWGAQLEEASFATSYITTTVSSATRSSDAVSSLVQDNIPQLVSPWSFSCGFYSSFVSNVTLCEFGDSLNQQRILFNSIGELVLRDGTTTVTLLASGSILPNTDQSLVVTYDGTNARAYLGGVSGGGFAASMVNVTGSSNWGSRSVSTEFLNGTLKDVRFYDFTLNQDEATYLNGV